MAQLTPVVKALLLINLGIYLLDTVLKGGQLDGPLRMFGAFTIRSAVYEGRIWEFLTFQFLHGSFGHVLFNSLGLFFFGPWMERWWGAARFLGFYLLCGVAGAVAYTLLVMVGVLPPQNLEGALIGASAGIYGIFIGVAVIAPSMRVALLFPPIELSMRQLAIALMVISAGAILLKIGGNEGGEAGHLGGAVLGYFLIRYPGLLGRGVALPEFRKRVVDPPPAKIRPRSQWELDRANELDRILDKISASGFQSLTDQERATLRDASNSINSPP